MRTVNLTANAEKEKAYKITDYKKHTKNYSGIRLFADKISFTLGSNIVTENPAMENFVQMITANDNVYALTEWGGVYGVFEGEFRSLFVSYESDAYLARIEMNGKPCVATLCPSGYCSAYDRSDVTDFTMPVFSRVCAMQGNRFFVAVNGRLIFETLDNLDNMNDGQNPFGNFIDLPYTAGDILALYPMGKKLVIIAQKAIYELSPSEYSVEFQIVKKVTLKSKLIQDTTAKIGDSVAFCVNGKLYLYTDGTLKEFVPVKNFNGYTIAVKCASCGEKYLLPVFDGKDYRVFYYDFSDCSEGDFISGSPLVSDNGYFIDANGYLRVISEEKLSAETGEWQSKPIDFNTFERKAIKGIMLRTEQKSKVYVGCEYGGVKLDFESGTNYKKLNLTSREFAIKITGETGLSVNNLRLTYALKGE